MIHVHAAHSPFCGGEDGRLREESARERGGVMGGLRRESNAGTGDTKVSNSLRTLNQAAKMEKSWARLTLVRTTW